MRGLGAAGLPTPRPPHRGGPTAALGGLVALAAVWLALPLMAQLVLGALVALAVVAAVLDGGGADG